MPTSAWKQLTAGEPWFHGAGSYPIQAYSEYLPPPRPACRPYCPDKALERVGACGWQIGAYEEGLELRPGLEHIGHHLLKALVRLGQGQGMHGISKHKRTDNPYWPEELSAHAGKLPHERYVVLLSLALSRTQDDKGRVRWTLFGGSERGPGKAFWKSFYTGPGKEVSADSAIDFLRRLLQTAYGLHGAQVADLKKAGFRILPDEKPLVPHWREGSLPTWTKPFLWTEGQPLKGVKYLLTFTPFALLPEPVKKAYLAGNLHLLPFPGSLLFWGVPSFHRLAEHLPFATQIPLQHMVPRHEAWPGLRVPQSGWLHEPHPDVPEPHDELGPVRNTYKRSHRWEKLHRHQDELAVDAKEDRLAHVLFSTAPHDLGLYGKPMARNAQIWTRDFRLVLDGPHATPHDLTFGAHALRTGGLFGYRFQFPAMRVGKHEIYWQRPLIGCLHAATDQPDVLHDGPIGYLTAYDADQPDLAKPIELWPQLDQDPFRLATLTVEDKAHVHHHHETVLNLRKLHETYCLRGGKLPRAFAHQLLTLPTHATLDQWIGALPGRIPLPEVEAVLEGGVRSFLEPEAAPTPAKPLPSLTYDRTATRSFEVAYWKTIAKLATGTFVNKDNADCVRDPVTQSCLAHHARDLERLGDYLLSYYRKTIDDNGLTGKALAGEIPFAWHTDFDFSWMGGWLNNQLGHAYERDLIVVVPGRDRKRAVIMADHYDTAYMLDRYDPAFGGNGARLAASGADDNHSATVALMLGAPIFMELSKQGKLACDVWLIHLTGEEFPSDCLGARALTQKLVEGNLAIHLPDGKKRDLSKTRVQGVYVLDMIAHNMDKVKDIFQISPGAGGESMWLAYQAHVANTIWNANAPFWNRKTARAGKGRGQRSLYPNIVPDVAAHPTLSGEVRPPYDPRSTIYNTDGQIFSDAGVPVVLFMENYDINRTGYHDTHDTMENIDLDYGSAVAAITIESVARAATEKPDV